MIRDIVDVDHQLNKAILVFQTSEPARHMGDSPSHVQRIRSWVRKSERNPGWINGPFRRTVR